MGEEFEEVASIPKKGQYMVMNLITLAGIAALSLGALVWHYSKLVPSHSVATSSVEAGGVALSSPLAVQMMASPSIPALTERKAAGDYFPPTAPSVRDSGLRSGNVNMSAMEKGEARAERGGAQDVRCEKSTSVWPH